VGLEEIFHQRDIFLGPSEPSDKSLSSGGLKTFDELLHSGIDDDGNIEIEFVCALISDKELHVKIVVRFFTARKRQGLNG
jgi:hypothetical protein